MTTLADKMRSLKTSPAIIRALIDGLQPIWADLPSFTTSHTMTGIDDATASQSQIGWWALICGKWSKKWELLQQRYLLMINSPRSPRRWQSSIIQLLWNTSWDLWDWRNSVAHSPASRTFNLLHQQLDREIQYLWNLGAPASFERQNYFRGSLASLLKMHHSYKQAWLLRVRPAVATRPTIP